jgi:hypothetical protein
LKDTTPVKGGTLLARRTIAFHSISVASAVDSCLRCSCHIEFAVDAGLLAPECGFRPSVGYLPQLLFRCLSYIVRHKLLLLPAKTATTRSSQFRATVVNPKIASRRYHTTHDKRGGIGSSRVIAPASATRQSIAWTQSEYILRSSQT